MKTAVLQPSKRRSITIPKEIYEEFGGMNSIMKISANNSVITIKRYGIKNENPPKLKEKNYSNTDVYVGNELYWGKPVGNEVW